MPKSVYFSFEYGLYLLLLSWLLHINFMIFIFSLFAGQFIFPSILLRVFVFSSFFCSLRFKCNLIRLPFLLADTAASGRRLAPELSSG